MKHLVLVLFAVLLHTVTIKPCASVSVPLFHVFAHCVDWNKQYDNPFNYSEVGLLADIVSPEKTVTIDGFYFQDYNRSLVNGKEHLQAVGLPLWCFRFSPIVEGQHSVTVSIIDKTGKHKITNMTFQATREGSDMQGYVRVGKNNIHFQFDGGKTYFPIGENVCWVSYDRGTYGYDNYFNSLAQHGGNYARLWLTDVQWDGLAVEISVGKYNLGDLWRLDYVVALAERLNMRLLMCTESFNLLRSKSGPHLWETSYYNKANGGILDHPQDFFTSELAKMDYKNRLRYLIARYSYSTSVFAWEYFNEVDITDDYNSNAQVLWINEMTKWVHRYDVNRHLISTSFSNSVGDVNVQSLDSLDFTMTHNYGQSDIAMTTALYAKKKLLQYHKPSYVAEFGISNEDHDKEGWSLHNGLWATTVQLAAGTCMTWWWDSWVAPNHLYGIFDGISRFVNDIGNLADYAWVPVVNATVSVPTLRLFAMYGHQDKETTGLVALWLQDSCSTWSQHFAGNTCKTQKNVSLSLSLPRCVEGTDHVVDWYNTTSGQQISSMQPKCQSNVLSLTAVEFVNDVAALVHVA